MLYDAHFYSVLYCYLRAKEEEKRVKEQTITDKVVTDLKAREIVGLKKYGHYVHESPDDMLQHLYEELMDAAIYIRTEIERRKANGV